MLRKVAGLLWADVLGSSWFGTVRMNFIGGLDCVMWSSSSRLRGRVCGGIRLHPPITHHPSTRSTPYHK
eukprot:scaffold23272_cov82-Skeletonema_dohrnii-CCMP3373.AAC.2